MRINSFWHLGGLSGWELLKRVARESVNDDVFGQAAKLAYYFLLALFPLLICLTSLLGYFAHTGSQLYNNLLAYFHPVLPHSAYELVVTTLQQIHDRASGGKLSFGILATLWAASNGIGAAMDGLNKAYEVREGRPWWKSQLLAVVLTIALSFFIVIALAIVLYGNELGALAADKLGFRAFFDNAWSVAQWLLVIGFVLLAFALLYRYAPDLEGLEWGHTLPGAVAALVLWLAVSLGFRLYLRYFNTYGATYGSLGAVMILMLWLYFTGTAILIGGEVNSEIESTSAKAGELESRLPGEKAPGERRRLPLPRNRS